VEDTSRRVGFPIAEWGLDQHDLDAIEASTDPPGERPNRDPQWEDHDRARPTPDRPEREPVDPLRRARDAVAGLPDPTGSASLDGGRHDAAGWNDERDDAVAAPAVNWAEYRVEAGCCGAGEEDLIDTAGDER
jgi:hypothetical protein